MKHLVLVLCLSVALKTAAAPFGSDLVVVRVGDGSSALTSAATVGFLDEFTFSGSLAQTIALPTASGGGNNILTFSGTATSEGFLIRSADGSVLTVAGYNAAPGTASITGSAASAINRVVGVVSMSGAVNTSTAISSGTAGNPRSVASVDGNQFYLASSSGGVGYVSSLGGASATQLSSTPANTRVAGIFGGQLYTSAASGAFQGLASIGSGVPTVNGQITTILPGFPTVAGPSSYGYFLADLNGGIAGLDTAWVADDRSIASGGGIQKWSFDGTIWSLQYTLGTGVGSTVGARGLSVDLSGVDPVIFATTSENSANRLISVTDTGSGSLASTLATAPVNTAFRGVSVVPEPATAVIFGVSGLLALVAIRRRR